jgi:hypothetical protein
MSWIYRISHLPQSSKEGFYRLLIPPSLYQRFAIDPLSLRYGRAGSAARFFCPVDDGTAFMEIQWPGSADPLYSIQISDTADTSQLNLDFVVANDPHAQRFNVWVDAEGRDTLFGWASRNLAEEQKAMAAGLFPGQIRKGLGLTAETIYVLEFFCRIFDIKIITLEALFYHNAVTYERHGFAYDTGYKEMLRIHELFQPHGKLYRLMMQRGSDFRNPDFAQTVRGRSWAIHDGILSAIDDDLLKGQWVSPRMYRMVGKPRGMITFPNAVY